MPESNICAKKTSQLIWPTGVAGKHIKGRKIPKLHYIVLGVGISTSSGPNSGLCLEFKSSSSGGIFPVPCGRDVSYDGLFEHMLIFSPKSPFKSLPKIREVHFSFVMEHLVFVRVKWTTNSLLVNDKIFVLWDEIRNYISVSYFCSVTVKLTMKVILCAPTGLSGHRSLLPPCWPSATLWLWIRWKAIPWINGYENTCATVTANNCQTELRCPYIQPPCKSKH